MDNSLKKLEANLEDLVPRGLSDQGREDCEILIDRLVAKDVVEEKITHFPEPSASWQKTAVAAAVILGVGLGSGWFLGQHSAAPAVVDASMQKPSDYLNNASRVVTDEKSPAAIAIIDNMKVQKVEEVASASGKKEVHITKEDGKLIKLRFTE